MNSCCNAVGQRSAWLLTLVSLVLVGGLVLAVGCGRNEDKKPTATPAAETDKPAAARKTLSPEDLQNVEKLPAGEKEAALKQQVCAVAGKPLGSMGVPAKVMVQDRAVFLCCKGCESKVKSDPEKVLRRVDELTAGQ